MSIAFVIELKKNTRADAWPRLLLALRQDATIWESLENGELGSLALQAFAGAAECMSPAALALLELGIPVDAVEAQLKSLTSLPMQPLPASLSSSAQEAYTAWRAEPGDGNDNLTSEMAPALSKLAQAGLLALALREQRYVRGGWDSVFTDLENGIEFDRPSFATALACLIGMTADRFDLLTAALQPIHGVTHPGPVIHGLLSNPFTEEWQRDLLQGLYTGLLPAGRLEVLKVLAAQRPGMAAQLYEAPGAEDGTHGVAGYEVPRNSFLEEISELLHMAEGCSLGPRPEAAVPLFSETVRAVRRLESHLAAGLAQAATRSGDAKTALDSWKLAAQLSDHSPEFAARLALSLIQADRHDDAQAYLTAREYEEAQPLHPALAIVSARLAARNGDTQRARELAIAALESLTVNRADSAHTIDFLGLVKDLYQPLPGLLLSFDLPERAVQAARWLLSARPNNPVLLAQLAQALSLIGEARAALAPIYAVLAGEGWDEPDFDRLSLRRILVDILEAAGEWQSALEERSALLETDEVPSPAAYTALARCALHAGQAQQAVIACLKIFETDPEYSPAYILLGQATQRMGDRAAALENFHKATMFAPDNAEAWLALAQLQSQSGLASQAVETLRTAALSAPQAPEIHLALGEMYLAQNAPTQALEPLRTAAALLVPVSVERRGLKGQVRNDIYAQVSLRLGQTLFQLGHLEEARSTLERTYNASQNAHQKDPELAYVYARILISKGDQLAAIEPLETVIASEPDHPAPYMDFVRAILENAGGKPDLLSEAARKAIPLLQRVLSWSGSQNNNPTEGIEQTSIVRMAKRSSFGQGLTMPAFHDLKPEAQILLAESLLESGDNQSAFDAYKRIYEDHGSGVKIYSQPGWQARLNMGMGRAALSLGQTSTAIAALEEAARLDVQNPKIRTLLCDASLEAGLPDEALAAARAALELAPSHLDTLVWFASRAGQLTTLSPADALPVQAEAIQALSRAVQIAPHRIDLLIRLGQMQLKNGDRSAAIETFARLATAVQNSGSNQETCLPSQLVDADVHPADLVEAAQYLAELGDAPRAVILLEHAAAQSALPGQEIEPEKRADLLSNLATAYWKSSNAPAALESLDQAIALEPTGIKLFAAKADMLMEMHRPQSALTCLENALSLAPQEIDLHCRMALVLREMGNLPEALDHAERATLAAAQALTVRGESEPELEEDYPVLGEDTLQYLWASSLGGEVARGLLQPEHARDLLGNTSRFARLASEFLQEVALDGDRLSEMQCTILFNYFCLYAELSLDEGETNSAAEALTLILALDPNCPRSLAAQARLKILEGERTVAGQLFTAALKAVLNSQSIMVDAEAEPDRSLISPTSQQASPMLLHGLAEAGLELSRWTEALALARQTALVAPGEPLAHLQVATVLVQRAEAQRLHASVDAIQHAPGPQSLDVEAYNAFSAAIQNAEEGLRRGDKGLFEQRPSLLARWQARGAAVFHPDIQTAEALQSVLDTACTGPHDAAALTAALGLAGERAAATRVAQSYPQHPLVMGQLALALSESNPRQALGVIRPAIDTALQQASRWSDLIPVLQILHARLAFCVGQRSADPIAALQAIQSALKAWPEEPRWHALAADILLGNGNTSCPPDFPAAIQHLEQAIQLEPGHPTHYLSLGQIYLEQGEARLAVQTLEAATAIAPNNDSIWMALAQAQHTAGELDEAGASAEHAIECATDPTRALLLRGELGLQTNNPRGALSRAQTVLRQYPEHPEGLYLLARALVSLNRLEEAQSALEKAIPLTHSPLSLQIERARLLRQTQGLPAALEDLQRLAETYPEETTVLALLADALIEDGQNDMAVQTARMALQADHEQLERPQRARLHFLVGRQLRRSGQLDQAVHHLSEATRGNPEQVEAYLELGRAHQDRRQHPLAVAVYQQAVAIAPNDHRPYYQAGLVLKESRDYEGAERMLRRAAELAPTDVSIHRLLGAVVALNLVHNRRQANPV